jgi:hypothetical protein
VRQSALHLPPPRQRHRRTSPPAKPCSSFHLADPKPRSVRLAGIRWI